MINKDKLIIDNARGKCEVTLNAHHKNITSDSYVLFAKADGEKHIEVNNLSLDEIQSFVDKLCEIIEQNKEQLTHGKDKDHGQPSKRIK